MAKRNNNNRAQRQEKKASRQATKAVCFAMVVSSANALVAHHVENGRISRTRAFSLHHNQHQSSPLSSSSSSSLLDNISQRHGRTHLSRTQLRYRDGVEEGDLAKIPFQAVRSKIRNLYSTLFPSPAERNQKQDIIDDYLEFVGKRYHRLHDDETSEPKTKIQRDSRFSAMDWLLKGGNNNADKTNAATAASYIRFSNNHSGPQAQVISHTPRSDALYVLGVADLASQRLLQKYRVSGGVTSTELRNDKAVVGSLGRRIVAGGRLFGNLADAGSHMIDRVRYSNQLVRMYRGIAIRRALNVVSRHIDASRHELVKTNHKKAIVFGKPVSFALALSALTAVFLLASPLVAAMLAASAK